MTNTQLTYPFAARCPFEHPPEFARLRKEAPVAEVRLPTGATGYLVTTHDLVRAVLADERFSRQPVRERAQAQQGGGFDFGMSIADPADHERWRRAVAQVLNVRLAERLRPRVAAIVAELTAAMRDRGGTADLMADFAYRLPLRVLYELFAVPDDLRPAFAAWASAMRGSGTSMAAFGAAMGELHAAAVELVGRGRAGVLADLDLPDEQVASTVLLVTVAGYETVAMQLGNGFLALFQHPAELARLRTGEAPVDAAVEEMLRYAQMGTGFAGITYTTEDVPLGDAVVPAGSAVFISLDSAGRDETHVDDPEVFAVARGAARTHLAFGAGAHFCLGAPLARVELQEAVAGLLGGLPGLALAPDPTEVPIAANRFHRYPAELIVTWRAS